MTKDEFVNLIEACNRLNKALGRVGIDPNELIVNMSSQQGRLLEYMCQPHVPNMDKGNKKSRTRVLSISGIQFVSPD